MYMGLALFFCKYVCIFYRTFSCIDNDWGKKDYKEKMNLFIEGR